MPQYVAHQFQMGKLPKGESQVLRGIFGDILARAVLGGAHAVAVTAAPVAVALGR